MLLSLQPTICDDYKRMEFAKKQFDISGTHCCFKNDPKLCDTGFPHMTRTDKSDDPIHIIVLRRIFVMLIKIIFKIYKRLPKKIN